MNDYTYADPETYTHLDTGGIKQERGKLQWSLVPWDAMEQVVKVLMYGAKKYNPDNWKKVYQSDPTLYADAMIRHCISYHKGERVDAETGLSPLASVICDALFLLWGDEQ